jgi:serralysin
MRAARHGVGVARWAIVCCIAGSCSPCDAYQLSSRWSTTAISGGGLSQGDPTTITWGLVDDGVNITGSEGTSPSSLMAFLNAEVGSADVWLPLFEDAFNRWGEVSGLTFVHEQNNSTSSINTTTSPAGSAGSVPDIRIGGHSIDGSSGSNTLAYNYFPNHSDMVLDTDNGSYFGNAVNNYRRLRNTVMHEAGHGLGLKHVESTNAALLMEPIISSSFDGPQIDDILAIQRLYGDAWEKNGGNDNPLTATNLGSLANGPIAIGTDAGVAVVTGSDVDFLSIDDNSDLDYFSFAVEFPSLLTVNLAPKGPTYNQGPQDGAQTEFDATAQSDLRLNVYDTNGTSQLAAANDFGLGGSESLTDVQLNTAGTYYVRVAGTANTVQLYQLDLQTSPLFLPGDVNLDGHVSLGTGDPADDDVAAFVAGWKTVLPTDDDLTAWSKGDLNLDRVSSLADWSILRSAFLSAGFGQQFQAWRVPEPATVVGAMLAVACGVFVRRRGC